MTRKNIILLWMASILYFVIALIVIQFLVWYAPGNIPEDLDHLVVILLVSPIVITFWTSFTIFYSLLAWPLITASPKPWLGKHKGGILYYLLWRELRDKLDEAPSH